MLHSPRLIRCRSQIVYSTDAWVGGALRRVTNAVTIAEAHGSRSAELESLTKRNLAQTIQQALNYGYSIEAVADSASLTIEEVATFADGTSAALSAALATDQAPYYR